MICSSGGVGRSAHWRRAVAQNEQGWRGASAMGQREVQQDSDTGQEEKATRSTADAAGRKLKAAVVRAVQGA
jgi:hypothetical protein